MTKPDYGKRMHITEAAEAYLAGNISEALYVSLVALQTRRWTHQTMSQTQTMTASLLRLRVCFACWHVHGGGTRLCQHSLTSRTWQRKELQGKAIMYNWVGLRLVGWPN